MSSEANLINLKNTSVQLFDLGVMTVTEKTALKRIFRDELIHVQSSYEKVGTGCKVSPGVKLSSVVESSSTITRSENAVEIVEAGSLIHSDKLMTTSCGNQQTSHACKRKDDMQKDSAELSAFKKSKPSQDAEKSSLKIRWKVETQMDQGMDSSRRKQCVAILDKLMTHKYGWVFNCPVDPIKLQIPDYFSIITKPMDLGTIKRKLKDREYTNANDFADDVNLTFSNAMRYNPPNNDFHLMAKKLCSIFNLCWKILLEQWDKKPLRKLHSETERQNVNHPHPEVQYSKKGLKDRHKCFSTGAPSGCREFLVTADEGGTNISADQHTPPGFCPSTPPATSSKGEERLLYEEQLSPSKALRAATLKSRFANTILKAQHRTLLNYGEKGDHEKLQKEVERLEREQLEEKERIEAQIRAFEAAAKRKQESEQKLQREKQREAARLAIQKMEKTVDIDENWGLPRVFQTLGRNCEMPDEVVADFMMGIDLLSAGSREPLEQLGLFMKNDELEEEEWLCDPLNTDVEEGEIGC